MFINSRAKPEEQGLINTQENEAENSVMMKWGPVLCTNSPEKDLTQVFTTYPDLDMQVL
jgi:hypothetical protein